MFKISFFTAFQLTEMDNARILYWTQNEIVATAIGMGIEFDHAGMFQLAI